jgi:RecB family exonuclease
VLEKGVSSGYKKLEEFIQYAKELLLEEEWESINIDEVETLIKVFFERHKNKYDEKSKTEQFLPLKIEGIDFIGFADRIDFLDNGIQIVDYKTGKTAITPKDRDIQLSFYALAAQEQYGKVRRVILDMLKQEKPLEFEIDDKGNAICTSSDRISGFNIYDVESEIVEIAKSIQEAYKKGFKPCPIEKNCEFCNEYVYGL